MRASVRFRPSQISQATSSPSSFICRNCRLARRPFSSTNLSSTNNSRPQVPPAAGLVRLSSRRLISVSGPDAAKYLQGVITASIVNPDGAARKEGFYSAFLTAQGRVLHDVFVYPDTLGARASIGRSQGAVSAVGESFLIEVDATEAERLEQHIKRYKLRAKFTVRLLDGNERAVWHAWDDTPARVGLEDDWGKPGGGIISLRDPRCPTLGHRFITSGGDASPPPVGQYLDQVKEDVYQIRRYLHGIAEGQDEIVREQALPLESNMDVMGAIDFRKGCYVGQELTIRTKHRGVVRKRILPCILYAEEQAMPDQLVYRPGIDAMLDLPEASFGTQNLPRDLSIGRPGKKGRSAGKWLKGLGNIGLAVCRLEIMTDVRLPGETTAAATFSPEDEFVIEEALGEDRGGHRFNVKAFVPLWLRKGLDQTP